jgi:hypothetical protein
LITIKEEFVGCTKWLRAVELGGSDAIVMWLVLKGYAASNPTDGFIPDEDIERLPGKPKQWRKAMKALEDCGRKQPDGTRSAGLLDRVQHGVQLHDYLDHAPSSAEVEERRRKERERKRAQRGTRPGTRPGTTGGTDGGTDGGTPSGTTGGTDDGTTDGTAHHVPAPPPARTRVPTQPDSTQPDLPPKPPAVAVDSGRIPCPPDLELTAEQREQLRMMPGVPDWAINQITAETRAKYADGSEPRTLERWRRTLVTTIAGRWNDSSRRPKPPEGTPQGPRKPLPSRARPITGPILDGPPPELTPEPPSAPRRTREEQLRELEDEDPEAANG